MRFRSIALLMAAWLCCGAGGASAEKAVSLVFEAEAGDKASVVVRRRKSDPGLTARGLDVTAVVSYTVEVTAKTDTGYRILWTPGTVELEGAPDELKGRLKPVLGGLLVPIEFDADASGVPVKITDRKAALERSLAFLERTGAGAPKVLKQVRSMFSSMNDRTLALLLAKDAVLLARWQSLSLPVGKSSTIEERRPNPLAGGAPLAARTTVELASVRGGVAEVAWTVDMDVERMKAAMIEALERMASRLGRNPAEVEAQLGSAKLSFEESGKAEIGVTDGWARKVSFRRVVTILTGGKASERKELVEITQRREP